MTCTTPQSEKNGYEWELNAYLRLRTFLCVRDFSERLALRHFIYCILFSFSIEQTRKKTLKSCSSLHFSPHTGPRHHVPPPRTSQSEPQGAVQVLSLSSTPLPCSVPTPSTILKSVPLKHVSLDFIALFFVFLPRHFLHPPYKTTLFAQHEPHTSAQYRLCRGYGRRPRLPTRYAVVWRAPFPPRPRLGRCS